MPRGNHQPGCGCIICTGARKGEQDRLDEQRRELEGERRRLDQQAAVYRDLGRALVVLAVRVTRQPGPDALHALAATVQGTALEFSPENVLEAARVRVPAPAGGYRPGERAAARPAAQQSRAAAMFAAGLTHEDCDVAVRELAERHHKPVSEVDSMVRLTHQRADLGHAVPERVKVINEVSRALGRGMAEPDREQVIALAHGWDDEIALAVSVAERHELASKGRALGPDGDFPIPDAHHLGLAKAEYKKGNLAGHSAAEVRRHINKNAKRLGLPGLDDEDSPKGKRPASTGRRGGQRPADDDTDSGPDAGGPDGGSVETTMALSASAGPLERARHVTLHGDSAEAVMARNPGFF